MKNKKILGDIDKIMNVADISFSKGSFYKRQDIIDFYFKEIVNEIEETKEQFKKNNAIYLEDECGDIFYDYIMLLKLLERDGYIRNVENVFSHSLEKFSERCKMSDLGDEKKGLKFWSEVKKKQKKVLAEKHKKLYGR